MGAFPGRRLPSGLTIGPFTSLVITGSLFAASSTSAPRPDRVQTSRKGSGFQQRLERALGLSRQPPHGLAAALSRTV